MLKIETIEVKGSARDAAKDMIKAQGAYKRIGSGSYGEVFGAKNSAVVYKLGDSTDNDGYWAFVKTLMKEKTHNPFLPKIHGVRVYKGTASTNRWRDEDEFFVVAMERLTSMPNKMNPARHWFCDQLERGSYSSDTPDKGAVLLGVKMVVPKTLTDALKVLRKAARSSSSADWDLHDGNFMIRGAKQLVVIDPLA